MLFRLSVVSGMELSTIQTLKSKTKVGDENIALHHPHRINAMETRTKINNHSKIMPKFKLFSYVSAI